jgi:acyl carrier protein
LTCVNAKPLKDVIEVQTSGELHVKSLEEQISRVLSEELGRDVRVTDSLDSLGIDSVRMAQLAIEIEDHFGFRVDEELLDVETVQELAEYVRSRSPGS